MKIISSQSIFLLLPCSSGHSNRFSLPYPRLDSKPRIIPDPFFRHCASLLCQNDHCRTTEGKIAFLFAANSSAGSASCYTQLIMPTLDHHPRRDSIAPYRIRLLSRTLRMISPTDVHRQGNGRICHFWLYWNCDFVFSSQRCLFHQGCAVLPQ